MKIWKTIIVDDEPLARLELRNLLDAFQQILVVGEADSVHAASEVIEELQPDLLFLDIDLGTHTGFDLLERTDCGFQIIFVTAFDKYAIRAFEINALDYLLKPVHPERLRETLKRLQSRGITGMDVKLQASDKLLIISHNQLKFISVDSVSYIEAKGDYTRISTENGVRGMVHQTMIKWTERLPGNFFLRVHRSFIVNIDHILYIEKKQNGGINAILKNNIRIPVSRKYMKEIRSRFSIE